MKCHLAGKHSIFQHLFMSGEEQKQAVTDSLQAHSSGAKRWSNIYLCPTSCCHYSVLFCICYEGLSELRKLLPCSKHQSTDRRICGQDPKHLKYLRTCESLPSIPLTQGASQATGCGLGMYKSRGITARWTGISIFNITIPFAILFPCILKNTLGGISAAVLFCLAGCWCHLLLCPPLLCLNSEVFAWRHLSPAKPHGTKPDYPSNEYVLSSWEKFSKT